MRAEFTPRAILLGGFFGLLFGAVTVYVGLRAGLTVAASIPIAVLSISILRAFGKSTILENNIVQTTGSAGESIAGGVIFTLPALIFLGFPLEYSRIFLLTLFGGWLGVFFMIPLRRQLIVKEHGNLLYPEGTACADVLIAGDRGGSFASRVFMGLGLGSLYTLFQNENMFATWQATPTYNPKWFPGSSIRANTTAEYLGVGYIIGPRIAGVIFAGGVFAWLVVMPAIKFFGGNLTAPLYPGPKLIADMAPDELWRYYIRPMGAGAVAAAGLITLLKTVPTIVAALRAGLADLKKGAGAAGSRKRTDDDLPMAWALIGAGAVLVMMWIMLTFKPVPGAHTSWFANIAAAIFVIVFGFLFVTVSSRITGLIGTSSNPISGMAIATLMATCAVFLVLGWTGAAFGALAITIGGVVCIASANAGNTSQDLKTGFLVGATPRKQQYALLIGVMVSVVAIGFTLMGMNKGLESYRPFTSNAPINLSALPEGVTVQEVELPQQIRVVDEKGNHLQSATGSQYKVLNAIGSRDLPDGKYLFNPSTGKIEVQWIQGIGSERAAAPQARLMATVISGILNQRLPWGLVLLGVFLVIAVELLGIRSLSFAVGFYIPMATTLAIFVGGLVRWLAESAAERAGQKTEETDVSPGSLYASGLIAAGGIVGLLGIAVKLMETQGWIPEGAVAWGTHLPWMASGSPTGHWLGVITFVALAYSLFHFARKPLETSK
ncbi:MAG: oligopeptide transporter, OPT family [Candidatus Koribacter versatilis]|uniref:Oligopeptide transporter, OPT family n=1 Tax=Candidatus Korobacter versatilis TaxID=658062 RepID=A0A932EQT9_9BACT|nr:oligopeptide transporter, OPT family [Candidatus Koribacter versatilis]